MATRVKPITAPSRAGTGVPPSEAEVIQGPLDEVKGPGRLHTSVSSLDSIALAQRIGIPDVLIHDSTVLTGRDFPGLLPASPFGGPPAPAALDLEGREVSRSQVQNIEVQADILLLEQAGATNIRVNQHQVIEDTRVGTNRPDLYAELNGRRVHIEYDRAPGTRAMDHARRLLTNDPDAVVILKIIDHD